jgi:hypothetical protein
MVLFLDLMKIKFEKWSVMSVVIVPAKVLSGLFVKMWSINVAEELEMRVGSVILGIMLLAIMASKN